MKSIVVSLSLSLGLLLGGCAATRTAWIAPRPAPLAEAPAPSSSPKPTCCEWNDQGQLACATIAEKAGTTRPGALRCEGARLFGTGFTSIDSGVGGH